MVILVPNFRSTLYLECRIFNSFTMETILAIASGRCVGELSRTIQDLMSGITDGQVEGLFLLQSMMVIGRQQ